MLRLLLLLVLPVLLASCASPGGTGAQRPLVRYQTAYSITYSPEGWPKRLLADLYLPEGTETRPAVIVIHGGSWATRDKRYYMSPVARKLAEHGFMVMNVTYRGAPKWKYPAPVEDVREAVKWLRRHAVAYHLDPKQIGVFGYSAGAQIAAQVGALDAPPEVRVQAVVGGGTPANMELFKTDFVVPGYMGGPLSKVPQTFFEASPVNHITPDDPPFFLYHGSTDRIVPPQHAVELDAALTRAGVKHELVWVKNRGHFTTFFFGKEAVRKAIDFLDQTLRSPAKEPARARRVTVVRGAAPGRPAPARASAR